jgi:MFS transporter, OFA family, oxalate/formate antiporter
MTTIFIQQKLESQRWLIAIAAIIMQLCLGTIYAWSVVKNDLVANQNWAEVPTSTTFMICIGIIGLAAAFGGKLVDQKGPKFVATIGGILFGVGTIIAGLAVQIHNLWLLYLGYGVLGGLGAGFGYVTPIATLIRWFPDKRGLVTGLAVMGFGAGAFIIGLIAPQSIANWGVANTLYIWGVTFLILIVASAQFLFNPPKDWQPAGFIQKLDKKTVTGYTFTQAVRLSQWWLLWAILCLNVTAGLGFISQLATIAKDLAPVEIANLSPEQVKMAMDAAGAFTVAIAAIFNGLGRLFWAWLSDGIGRKLVFSIMFLSQAVLYLIIPHISNYYFFIVIACYLLSCFGGGFATMPAFVADSFGAENIGRIYGTMLTAWGVAGVVGPLIFAWIKQSAGSYNQALYVATGLLVLGFILTRMYKRPRLSV